MLRSDTPLSHYAESLCFFFFFFFIPGEGRGSLLFSYLFFFPISFPDLRFAICSRFILTFFVFLRHSLFLCFVFPAFPSVSSISFAHFLLSEWCCFTMTEVSLFAKIYVHSAILFPEPRFARAKAHYSNFWTGGYVGLRPFLWWMHATDSVHADVTSNEGRGEGNARVWRPPHFLSF